MEPVNNGKTHFSHQASRMTESELICVVSPRYVTATIRNATGDPEAVLGGNSSVPFTKGTANFTNLSISHSGRDYILDFKISYQSRA